VALSRDTVRLRGSGGASGLALLLAILFLGASAIFGLWYVPRERTAAVDSRLQDLSIRANIWKSALGKFFSDGLADAETLASYPTVHRAAAANGTGAAHLLGAGEATTGHLEEIFSDFARLREAIGVVLWDAAGIPVAKNSGYVVESGCRGTAGEVFSTGAPAFGFHDHPRLGPVLTFAAPVRADDGRIQGAVVVTVDPRRWLYPILVPFSGSTGEAFLVARDGTDAVFLSPLRFRPDAPLAFRQPLDTPGFAVRAALDGNETPGRYVDYRGVRVLAAGRRLAPSPWALVVKVDEDEALVPFRAGMRRTAFAGAAVLLAVLGVVWGVWQRRERLQQAALVLSEERHRSLFDGMLEGYALCEMIYENGEPRDFVYLDVNPAFEKLTGLKNVVGKRVTEVLPGIRESDPELFAVYGRVASTGTPEVFEVYLDALKTWFAISAYSPKKGQFVAVFDNVTDRKLAEKALEKSELYFKSLIEHAIDITAVLGPGGEIRYVSPSVERVLGYLPAELRASGVFDLVHPEYRPEMLLRLQRVQEEGTPFEVFEGRLRHRDGSWRTLSVIGKALPSETGMQGVIINARDISERLQLEAQLRQAQKMEAVGRLAGGVAHDFNNVLTVIQGYGELLSMSLRDDETRREQVAEIVKAAGRAAALTRQLLAFSRRQVFEMRLLDLGAVVAEMQKMLLRLIGEDIELLVLRPAGPLLVKADPGQIEQVLMNLAVNSRDAMPNGGRLTLRVEALDLDLPLLSLPETVPPGRYVVLRVDDTGCGMDAETLGHAFEPFFTTKERGKGTGLGLSTVFGTVKQSGGFLDVESAPGHGTVFRVFLPRAEEEAAAKPEAPEPGRGGTETVLLVEDETPVRELARLFLEGRGYRVLAAGSGAEALELAGRHEGAISLLLTDVVMPGMNGRELAVELVRRRPEMRVLFMSGYSSGILSRHRIPEAEAHLLEKPFTEAALAGRVRQALDRPASAHGVVG
jgi:PAS domain S-box-containing protein